MKQILAFVLLLIFLVQFTGCVKKPVACFDISSEQVIIGDSITVISCSENADHYSWEFGDDTLRPGSAMEIHQMNEQGYKIISLWAYGKKEYAVAQRAVNVFYTTAKICRYDSLVDPNDTVHFAKCSTGDESFLWNFGDGSTSSENYPKHVYSAPGLYTTILTSTTAGGNLSVSDSVLIGVRGVPAQNYIPGTYMVSDNCVGSYPLTIELSGTDVTLHNIGNFSPPIEIHGRLDSLGGYMEFPWQLVGTNPPLDVIAGASFSLLKLTLSYEYTDGGPHTTCSVIVFKK